MKLADPTQGLNGTDLEMVRLRGESLTELRDFWDEAARVDAIKAIADSTDEVSFESSGKQEAEELLAVAPSNPVVLEIGCGIGRIMQHLAPHCAEVHGIDISSEMVERGAGRLAADANVHFHHGNGYDLSPLEDQKFDLVYSSLVFQHVPKPVAYNYLTEVHRVLKPRGVFRLQVPNLTRPDHFNAFRHFSQPYFVEHPYPMNFYTPAEVAILMANANLVIESITDYMIVVARRTEPGAVDATVEAAIVMSRAESQAVRELIERQQAEIAELRRICDHWTVSSLRAVRRTLKRASPRRRRAASHQLPAG